MIEGAQTLVMVFDRAQHLMTASPAQELPIQAAQQAALAKGKALGLRASLSDEAAARELVSLRLTLYEGSPDTLLITSTHRLLPEEQAVLDAALKAMPAALRSGYEDVATAQGRDRLPASATSGASQAGSARKHCIAALKEMGIDARLLAVMQHAIEQENYDDFFGTNGPDYLTGVRDGIYWALGISLTSEQCELLESWITVLHRQEEEELYDSTRQRLERLYLTVEGERYFWEFEPVW